MSAETHLSELEEEMAQAVASEDFETAAALRDQIELIRRDVRVMEQPGADAPQASYLKRQEPDPMTTGHSKGGRRVT
jgi:excinuclease UvrABC nuclease subunit